jgi:rubredoxin
MPTPLTCPECGADFRGKRIPRKNLKLYGDETHFSRVVGLYGVEADATIGWECPDCHHRWAPTERMADGFRTFDIVMVSTQPPEEG